MSISLSFPELIFRGGTALTRIYWPDFRLSEDLDFIAEDPVDNLEVRLGSSVADSSRRIERPLKLSFGLPKNGWSRSTVESEFGELILDINLQHRVYLPVEKKVLDLPYFDLSDKIRIRCISLAEILGNKWFMLDDREEPRDLYDLWAAFTKFGIDFDQVVLGHRAAYGHPPLSESLKAAHQLQDKWERRLRHQLSELPALDEVVGDMQAIFDSWATSPQNP